MSHDSSVKPNDFGTHHCLNSSGLVHASNTIRAGPLIVRDTTSSRGDFRSDVVRFFMGVGSLAVLVSIAFLLAFQFIDHLLQFIEARVPEPAVALDPRRLILQPARAEAAGPHAADLLGRHETRLLQHADVLLHARQRHTEPLGEGCDRGVFASQLLQHATAGSVRERGERGIEAGRPILNHMVQYIAGVSIACKWVRRRTAAPLRFRLSRPLQTSLPVVYSLTQTISSATHGHRKMAPTISDSAYAILRVLAARGRRVVTTREIREAVGFDPHPMLGRDIVGRRWADPWDSPTLPEKRGVQITEVGKAAFELGRLERGDAAPEPVRAPVIRTGKARGESGA